MKKGLRGSFKCVIRQEDIGADLKKGYVIDHDKCKFPLFSWMKIKFSVCKLVFSFKTFEK